MFSGSQSRKGITVAVAALLSLSVYSVSAGAQDSYVTEDAHRFAELYKAENGNLTADILQERYLAPGTKGIEIFTPGRIQSAENLANVYAKRRAIYERAINTCLPWVDEVRPIMMEGAEAVAELLKQNRVNPVYVLFGAGNSGGTASSEGQALGLEVVCSVVETRKEFFEIMEFFAHHEATHTYQKVDDSTLLKWVLKEGFADFVAEHISGRPANLERAEWALPREAALWAELLEDNEKDEYSAWVANAGREMDRPSELGYWMGMRAVERYYNEAEDKEAALQTLLALHEEDIETILAPTRRELEQG